MSVPSSSDFGRRLRHRREELGYSIEQAAAAASIDPAYLDYLETGSAPDPSRGTVLRLAMALKTSPAALLGGNGTLPPGHGVEDNSARSIDLDPDTCMQLIAPGGVGRVVFVDADVPIALPVNFGVLGGDVVFRTGGFTSIATGALERRISFEVDRIDDAFAEGWSVLIRGAAHEVSEPAQREAIEELGVRPWVGGARETYFCLEPEHITGRKIVSTTG